MSAAEARKDALALVDSVQVFAADWSWMGVRGRVDRSVNFESAERRLRRVGARRGEAAGREL